MLQHGPPPQMVVENKKSADPQPQKPPRPQPFVWGLRGVL
jgi:hypothetical protein